MNHLIKAPTGWGKTAKALELIKPLLEERGLILFVVPTRALIEQFNKQFSYLIPLGFSGNSLNVCMPDFGLVFITPEKLDLYTRNKIPENENIAIIIDEIHEIASIRGASIEVMLARLGQYSKSLIGLTSSLNEKDLKYLSIWFSSLNNKNTEITVIENVERRFPIEITEVVVKANKFNKIPIIEETVKIINQNKNSRILVLLPDKSKTKEALDSLLDFPEIHQSNYSGNNQLVKNFNERKTDLLFATSGLGVGVTLEDVDIVIVAGILRGYDILPEDEINNFVGRCGRTKPGKAFIIRHSSTELNFSKEFKSFLFENKSLDLHLICFPSYEKTLHKVINGEFPINKIKYLEKLQEASGVKSNGELTGIGIICKDFYIGEQLLLDAIYKLKLGNNPSITVASLCSMEIKGLKEEFQEVINSCKSNGLILDPSLDFNIIAGSLYFDGILDAKREALLEKASWMTAVLLKLCEVLDIPSEFYRRFQLSLQERMQ